jgi:hypothetical protein
MAMFNNLSNIPLTIFIVCAIIFIIGIFVGIVIILIFQSAKGHESSKEPVVEQLREILSLARDTTSNKLVLKVQDKTYPDASSLPQDWYEGILRLAREWNTWLGLGVQRMESQPTPIVSRPVESSPPNQSTQVPTIVDEVIPLPPPVQIPAPVTQLPVQIDSPPLIQPNKQPSVTITPPVKKSNPKDKGQSAKPTLSIVEQIDEILQGILARNPVPGLTLRLSEDPREGVIVWVNSTRCVGIDAVNDPRAKEILRDAVQAWEQHQDRKP